MTKHEFEGIAPSLIIDRADQLLASKIKKESCLWMMNAIISTTFGQENK